MNKNLNPLQGLDVITGGWAKATYDTPLSKVPIIGLKSPLNPLGKAYRRAYALGEFKGHPEGGFFIKLSPMLPAEGPPLPKELGLKWPWKK